MDEVCLQSKARSVDKGRGICEASTKGWENVADPIGTFYERERKPGGCQITDFTYCDTGSSQCSVTEQSVGGHLEAESGEVEVQPV